MQIEISEFVKHLCCPDDKQPLNELPNSLICCQCQRQFPRIEDRIFEILPSRPAMLPALAADSVYAKSYRTFFYTSFVSARNAVAWGAPETTSHKWTRRRRNHVAQVMQLLNGGSGGLAKSFCDFSAGAGNCTFEAAKMCQKVFHCDLSPDSLVYAWKRALASGCDNMIFIRADYFAPPFCASLDRVVCLDTLIRGDWHEQWLLESVRQALAPSGAAVVDFHNWWHNPLRRLHLLPDNFRDNRSYALSELTALLNAAGIAKFEIRPFIQEESASRASVLRKIIPPVRFLVRISSHAESSATEFSRSACQ